MALHTRSRTFLHGRWPRPPRPLRFWLVLALLGLAASMAIAVGAFAARRSSSPSERPASGAVEVLSEPAGASLEVDGQARGSTPTALDLSSGEHRLTLRREGYIPSSFTTLVAESGRGATVNAALWLESPRVDRLRPTYPGATSGGAAFLSDGRVDLSLVLPPGRERELWVVDAEGLAQRVGPTGVRGSVTASLDRRQVAYLNGQAQSDSGVERLDEVWAGTAGREQPRKLYELPPTATGYRLSDLSWEPDGKHLLLVSQSQPSSESSSTHFVSLDVATGATDEVLEIPLEVVEGSLAWSPDGKHVAFLTRSLGAGGSAISLCLLDVESGDFRYLADLGRDGQGSLPFVPLSWSPDGQSFVYSATEEGATQSPSLSLSLLGGKPPQVLYRGNVSEPRSERIGAAEGQFPVWRSDGQLLALARSNGGGPLVVRAIDPSGKTTDVGQVPLRVQGSYSVLWDAPHAQALLALHSSTDLGSSSTELWWLHFRPEVDR